MRECRIKKSLRQGQAVAVPEVNHFFSPKLIEILGLLGYECAWVDSEHSELDFKELSALAVAARAADIDLIVRVPYTGYTSVIRPLELGATGLILPHCKSPAMSEAFVREAKFAPVGLRGIGRGPDSDYLIEGLDGYLEHANRETFLVVQIEDREGVEQVEAIAATAGVDLLFVGPVDLSQSLGVPGRIDHPTVLDAIENVARACRKHRKWWGLPAAPGPALEKYLRMGAQFFNCATDIDGVISGYSTVLSRFNTCVSQRGHADEQR